MHALFDFQDVLDKVKKSYNQLVEPVVESSKIGFQKESKERFTSAK